MLIEPEAQLLNIEQQLDLCLPPPMAWQFEPKTKEQFKKEEDVERENGEGENVDGEEGEIVDEIEVIANEIGGEVKEEDEFTTKDGMEEPKEELEDEVCKREHKHDLVENVEPQALKVYKIIKGEWTCATFHAMLEYFYTERCHVSCEEVAPLWIVATQIILQSLTNIIILHPINEYMRLALKTEANRRHLLKLANVSYKSDLNTSKLLVFIYSFLYYIILYIYIYIYNMYNLFFFRILI
jgi:hypothetical protein